MQVLQRAALVLANAKIILLPDQAHVLTVRENARLQGFPDYYHISVPIKEKYIQADNVVVDALGYPLGWVYKGESEGRGLLFVLNESFTDVRQNEVVVKASGWTAWFSEFGLIGAHAGVKTVAAIYSNGNGELIYHCLHVKAYRPTSN